MRRAFAVVALAWTCIGSGARVQAQCVVGGGGGPIPAVGTGDGVYPTTLPSSPLVSALAVTVPNTASVLKSVKLRGLMHARAGNLQITLRNPAGAEFNVLGRLGTATLPNGCNGTFAGDYEFFGPISDPTACGGSPGALTCSATIAPGSYLQRFGTWPGGAIANTPLEQIPISSGVWTLKIYDWASGNTGSLTGFDLCFGAPTDVGEWLCIAGGAGGTFQQNGFGAWPNTLPSVAHTSTLSVTVPASATQITAVKLNNLQHTWLGDAQIVLSSPAGVHYNLFQENDGGVDDSCPQRFAGDYAFVDPLVGGSQCGGAASSFQCSLVGPLTVPSGAYGQFYGAWPSGAAGVVNVNLSAIPLASGDWTLTVYDWYPLSDGGSLGSWELCFDAPRFPLPYCTAGTTTNGCVPTLAATAQPSASLASACTIHALELEGQRAGLVFYGVDNAGFVPSPWGAGSSSFLCVKPPIQRMFTQVSGGSANHCDGVFSQSWNAFQAAAPASLGNPFAAGDKLYAQGWFRDPAAPKSTNLTNALELSVAP